MERKVVRFNKKVKIFFFKRQKEVGDLENVDWMREARDRMRFQKRIKELEIIFENLKMVREGEKKKLIIQ